MKNVKFTGTIKYNIELEPEKVTTSFGKVKADEDADKIKLLVCQTYENYLREMIKYSIEADLEIRRLKEEKKSYRHLKNSVLANEDKKLILRALVLAESMGTFVASKLFHQANEQGQE